MIEHVVLSGCSLAYGQELKDRNSRYGKKISDYYDAELHDVSVPGNCNQLIADYMIEKVSQLLQSGVDPSRIFVILSWTFPMRIAFYNKNLDLFYIVRQVDRFNLKLVRMSFEIPEDDQIFFNSLVRKYFHRSKYYTYDFLRNLLYTQSFLKSLNIRFISTLASSICLDMIENNGNKIFTRNNNYSIVSPKFIVNSIDMDNIFRESFFNMCGELELPFGERGHPLEEGHNEYYKKLLAFIELKHELH